MQSDIFDIAVPGGYDFIEEFIPSNEAYDSGLINKKEKDDSDTFIEDFGDIDLMIAKK